MSRRKLSMKNQITVAYNPIIISLFTYSKPNIKYDVINGVPYLISEKALRKARISLRAKIPIQDLLVGDEIYGFNHLSQEKQDLIKQKLKDRLSFTAQEIFMFCYILSLYLDNNYEIDLSNIHIIIRSQGKIDIENARDLRTLSAYKKAIKNLENKILRVEIDGCNPRLYGVSNKHFTQSLLETRDNCFILGNIGKILELSGHFSNDYIPKQIFNCRLNQITKFLLAYILSYEIYSYKRNNPHIKFYEIKFTTLLKKLPYFHKNGTNSGISYYQHIQYSKSKTQIIERAFRNCIEILKLYVEENIIVSYTMTPNINKINVKNFEKVKFCVNLRG